MRVVLSKLKITLLFLFCFVLISACSNTDEETPVVDNEIDAVEEDQLTEEVDEENIETNQIEAEEKDIPPTTFTATKLDGQTIIIRNSIDASSTIDREIIETLTEFNAEEVAEGTMLTLPEDILFDFDSSELRPEADEEIDNLVQLTEETDELMTIIGHTDSRGADDYNQKLSEGRAQAVVDALVNKNVAEERLEAIGKGASEPIAENTHSDGSDNPEGRQKNRRVEVIVHGFEH